jgi:hypothetical protein
MPRHRLVVLVAWCAWLVPLGSGARAQVNNTFEVWTAAFLDVPLAADAPDARVWMDLHLRRGEQATQLIARPAFFYRLSKPVSVWAGYAYTPLFREGERDRHEHRTWQQVQVVGEHPSGWGGQLRTRLEQRFVHGSDEVGWRVRQLLRGWYRVSDELLLAHWHELFVGLHAVDWGMPAGLDLWRTFAGPAYVWRPGLRLEVGYLGQWARRAPAHLLIHALSINLYGSW